MLPEFTSFQWVLAGIAAFCIGFSKGGIHGVGLLNVLIMAWLFPARESTGVLLPMLIAGDILSVLVYHQHAQWRHIGRMLLPTVVGVIAGWLLMDRVPAGAFGPAIGGIVLAMTLLQAARRLRPALFAHIPHTRSFAWTMGVLAGVTTMFANAAGPVMGLYLLAVGLPKLHFLGTSAWFFLIVNVAKVPFSVELGLISWGSLGFNALLVPAIAAGIYAGRRLVAVIPQELFERLLLAFTAIAALRMLGVFYRW